MPKPVPRYTGNARRLNTTNDSTVPMKRPPPATKKRHNCIHCFICLFCWRMYIKWCCRAPSKTQPCAYVMVKWTIVTRTHLLWRGCLWHIGQSSCRIGLRGWWIESLLLPFYPDLFIFSGLDWVECDLVDNIFSSVRYSDPAMTDGTVKSDSQCWKLYGKKMFVSAMDIIFWVFGIVKYGWSNFFVPFHLLL